MTGVSYPRNKKKDTENATNQPKPTHHGRLKHQECRKTPNHSTLLTRVFYPFGGVAGGTSASSLTSTINSPGLRPGEKSSTSSISSSSSSSSSSVMPIISPLRRPCTLVLLLPASPPLRLRHGFAVLPVPILGPLKGERLRFANIIPGDEGGAIPKAALLSDAMGRPKGGAPARTSLMLEGKVVDVGVAGRTLMLLCGDFFVCEAMWPETVETEGEAMEADEVDEALLCVWWWCGIERMLETEEDVDLRPRRPPDERR